ncbi:MAG: ATP-binding cassette domain-containing protein, partial [Clostridia bacterium]|nr:ATP-binding cassette domain-containing protein [Clostridia bacterium]
IFSELQSGQAAVERVITLMSATPEITDSEEVIKSFGGTFEERRENWPAMRGSVDFKDVTFRYQSGQTVLEHFNLCVRPGERIALVGQTGGGKSTIVNLLCRFYEPSSGHILIDGVDYRERSQQWLHANLGYVLQSPHLFSGSIRENIRYGRLDATDAQVEEVARLIHADTFISRLENGYNTEVGESGAKLSTGEKQLVSFARAILADPALFVLDEATSSIDTQAEQAIQYAMEKTLAGRTSFIIAHRLSTVRSADRILVIEDGRIAEEGTHAQLLRLRGRYYRLYFNQSVEEANGRILGYEITADDTV